jgi:hypothetical protein
MFIRIISRYGHIGYHNMDIKALFQKHKNIFLFGGIFVLLSVGYYVLFGTTSAPTTGVSRISGSAIPGGGASLITAENAQIEEELISELLKLRSIKLDNRIFTSPAFQSLEDFGHELVPEPVGRPNPFAPVEED